MILEKETQKARAAFFRYHELMDDTRPLSEEEWADRHQARLEAEFQWLVAKRDANL